ncbi:hypothetical protein [Terrilactibacillus laevilacticus]|uniref:Uncharacterized protein n=1 Tax=Terrilactibacillus laevilacticus TaxID=1380157 RepID=A0ABW5PU25_9BACI|nr:hypothetical protein [Terrilactibacillus laevilacticus]
MDRQIAYILALIQNSYGFKEIKPYRQSKFVISTDTGLKRIRIWPNEAFMKWHIEWRHRLFCDAFFMDRMYITQSGNEAVSDGSYWITCHDEIEKEVDIKDVQHDYVKWIGQLLTKSVFSTNDHSNIKIKPSLFNIEREYQKLTTLANQAPRLIKLLTKSYPAVVSRSHQADLRITPYLPFDHVLLTPPMTKLIKTKSVYGKLFVELGQEEPTIGYGAISNLIKHWYTKLSENQFHHFIHALVPYGLFEKEIFDKVTAEMYYPNEWIYAVESSNKINSQEKEERMIHFFKKQWDLTNEVLTCMEDLRRKWVEREYEDD